MSDEEGRVEKRPRARRTRARRLGLLALLAVVVGFVVLVVLVPTILSSEFARSRVVRRIDRSVAGSVEIRGISLSWLDGQRIEGVELRDPTGAPVLQIADVSADRSLWRLLSRALAADIGPIKVRGLSADLVVAESGQSNLREALRSSAEESGEKVPEPTEPGRVAGPLALMAANIDLVDGRVTITAPDTPPITFEEINASVSVSSLAAPITFSLSGRSQQGDLSGGFTVNGQIENLVTADGRVALEQARGRIEATLTEVPVRGIDHLLGMRGLVASALGDRLDLTARVELAAVGSLALSVKAPNLTADIDGRVTDGTLGLTRPASVRFVLTGGFVEQLVAASEATSALRLAESVPLHLTIDQLRTGLSGFDPAKTALRAALRAERKLRLTGDPTIGDLTMDDVRATVQTDDPTEAVVVTGGVTIVQNGKPGKVEVTGELVELFDPAGALQLTKLRADAAAQLTNLPVALIDRATRQRGLLLEALGPTVTAELTSRSTGAERAEVKLAIKTERLGADVPLLITDRVENAGSIRIDYRLSSELGERYIPKDWGVTLRPETPIQITVGKLSAAVPAPGEAIFQPGKTVVEGEAQVGGLSVVPPGTTERIMVDAIVARLGGPSLADAELNASAKVVVTGDPGRLRSAVGTHAELDVRVRATVGPEPSVVPREVLLDLTSDRLRLHLPITISTKRVASLTRAGRVDLTVEPRLLTELGLASSTRVPWIGAPTRVTVGIDRLDLPLETLAPATVRLVATGTVTAASADDALGLFLGPTAKLILRLNDEPAGKPEPARLRLAVSVESDRLKTELGGEVTLGERSVVSLRGPATVEAVITPEGLAMLTASDGRRPTLAGPTLVRLEIARLSVSAQPFDPATLRMAMTAAVDKLELVADGRPADVSLRDGRVSLELDGPAGTAAMTLDARAAAAGGQAATPLTASAKVSQLLRAGVLDPWDAAVDGQVKLEGLPTLLVEAVSGQGGKLVPLVGPRVDLAAAAQLTGVERPSGVVELKAAGQNLTADVGLRLGETIALSRPATVKLVVTPAAAAALGGVGTASGAGPAEGAPAYALAAPATVEATVNRLAWPMKEGTTGAFDPARGAIDAALAASRLALTNEATGQGAVIDKLRASVKAPNLAGPVAVAVTAEVGTTGPAAAGGAAPSGGQLRVAGELRDLFKRDGRFDEAGLSADLTAALERVPVGPIDAWLGQQGVLLATLGPELSLAGEVRLKQREGPVELSVRATHARGTVNGRLDGGALKLAKPLQAEVEVTEALGRRVLVKINPIFETARSSERPIQLEIRPEGFVVPIEGFDLRKIVVPHAKLDLGKITLRSGSLLGGVIGLAQKFGQLRGAGREEMVAWFTPLLWEMRDGQIRYSRRLDLFLDGSQHLASWGIVDQGRDRLDLVLAIMPVTLDKIFDIENVEPDDAFVIPVTGSTSSPRVDWARATIDLGRLQAQAKLASKGQEQLGSLLGALAKGALRGRGAGGIGQGRIPPPSVDPLPWSGSSDPPPGPRAEPPQRPPSASQPPARTEKAREKPPEQELLEEAIQKGLKRLFQ